MMNSVIISGISGFIGNAVARRLIAEGTEVTGVVRTDVKSSPEAFRLDGLDAELIECNLNEMDSLPEKVGKKGFDVFYQFAWDGLSKEALDDYVCQMNNVKWMAETVMAASRMQCKKVVGAGSITQTELYTKWGRQYTKDKHKFYRAAQLASEIVCRGIARNSDIEFVWPIIVNVYGEGETNPRLINSLIDHMIKNTPFPLSSGEQLYDFLHIEDAARAFCLIGEYGRQESQYVLSSGNPMPLREYILKLRDLVSPDYPLEFSSRKFSGYEIEREWFDISALKKDTGFKPEISFEEGVKRILKWMGVEDYVSR